jgi:hypothetical protein
MLIRRRPKLYFYSIWYLHSLWAAVYYTGWERTILHRLRADCSPLSTGAVCHPQKLDAPFKRGDVSTCVSPRSGRHKRVTTPVIIDQIHKLLLEDRRVSAKSIAEQLGTSRGRVGSIIHEDLDMRKLSANWVPKCLNADQNRQRCQSSEQILEFFR